MRIKVDVPSPQEISGGLDLATVHPALTAAEQAAVEAEAAREDARQRLREATTAAEAMPGKVRAGTHTTQDLEAALSAQRVAALALRDRDEAVTAAGDDLERKRAAAVRALQEEAGRRSEALQALADRVVPVLEALRDAEVALHDAATGAVRGVLDSYGRPSDVSLPSVEWPSSLAADGRHRATAHQRDLASSGLTGAEWARRYGVGGRDEPRDDERAASL